MGCCPSKGTVSFRFRAEPVCERFRTLGFTISGLGFWAQDLEDKGLGSLGPLGFVKGSRRLSAGVP